jgi:hypothetical protein
MVKLKSISKLFFILLFLANLSHISCILPIYDPPSGRGSIDTSKIKPGATTKEDLFLQFGDAFTKVGEDEKLFMANFAEQGNFGVIGFLGGSGPEFGLYSKKIYERYQVEVEFDNNDVVKRCEKFKLPREIPQKNKTIENQ